MFIFLAVILFSLAGVLVYLHGFVGFSLPPRDVRQYFKDKPFRPHEHADTFEGRKIHFVEIGTAGQPLVLLIHGSPGNWDDYIHLMGDTNLLSRVNLIAVDRPGFGPMKERGPETRLVRQAKAIASLLDRVPPGQRAIVVGHSYGGAVAARLTMDFPDRVGGLILLAPPLDPALEEPKWYQIPGNWSWIAWALPHVWVNSNREILALKDELEQMLEHWENVRVPVTLLQGSADQVVDPEHAAFVEGQLTNTTVTVHLLPGQDHDLLVAVPGRVGEAILEHVDRLAAHQKTPM